MFPKSRDDRVTNPNPKKGRVLGHQQRRQYMESVARSIMVIVLKEWIIVLVVVKVCTRFEIAQM